MHSRLKNRGMISRQNLSESSMRKAFPEGDQPMMDGSSVLSIWKSPKANACPDPRLPNRCSCCCGVLDGVRGWGQGKADDGGSRSRRWSGGAVRDGMPFNTLVHQKTAPGTSP